MSKIPAPILPQPGAVGASQASNVVQRAVAPQKAPIPQLFGLSSMSQNGVVPQNTQPNQVTPQVTPDPYDANQMYRYLYQ